MEDDYNVLNKKSNVLTLGPGGIKGFLQLGALQHLENTGYLDNIHYYCGCSAGAIICFLIILGYDITQIILICLKYDILFDIRNIDIPKIKNKMGLISNDQLRKILLNCVEDKFGFPLTMEELYQATGCEFTIITVNVDSKTEKTVQIDHNSHPDISCVDAVLLSSNLPFIFYQMQYKGEVYIDGAFGNPYPVDVYDKENNYTIGMYITFNQTDVNQKSRNNPIFYLDQTLDVAISKIRKLIILNSSERCQHIPLFFYNPDPIGFTTGKSKKISMILEGYKQIQTIFETRDNKS